MEERSIRIEIAGRAYPLSIQADEEQHVRQAAEEINESITRLRSHYPMTDKQDLLAMAAMEVCVRALNSAARPQEAGLAEEVVQLEALLADEERS